MIGIFSLSVRTNNQKIEIENFVFIQKVHGTQMLERLFWGQLSELKANRNNWNYETRSKIFRVKTQVRWFHKRSLSLNFKVNFIFNKGNEIQ